MYYNIIDIVYKLIGIIMKTNKSVINIPFLKKMVDKITKNWSNKPLNAIE